MNATKYRNRDALNKALDQYLDAMFQFVSECLDEPSIREFLRLLSDDDLRNEVEVKDIADLIKRYWSKSFKEKFKIIDRYDTIRYYDARSVTSLIIEGRNQVSHQRLKELNPEFTRAQLFLIAEILGKIKRRDAQRKVESIRDELFDNTAKQLVTTAVEAEKAKYEQSIAKVKGRLAAAEKDKGKLSKKVDDNAAKLDKKKEELEKLSEQLVGIKLSKRENEKQFSAISKQLEKVQAAHSTCEERLTSIETERDDYKKGLETTSEQLDKVNERLSITSDQLLAVKGKRDTSVEHLAAIQKLLTVSTINDQSVFPPLQTDSTVRILDRRGVDKKNYLLELLEQKQPAIIYVQSEEMVETLLDHIVPEKADFIEKHGEQTSEAEETEILERLENGELIAVVSNSTISTLQKPHHIEHFVFCHPTPDLDTFFKRCQSVFTSAKNAYLHLIYNNRKDIEGLDQWLAQKYPDKEALRGSYRELKNLAKANGGSVKLETIYNALDMVELGIETGLTIFEELGFLERDGRGIITPFLSPMPRELEESETYSSGEELKRETAEFRVFQLEDSIEQIWEKTVEKLNVDSKQILRERDIYRKHFEISEKDDIQPTTETEEDKVTPSIPDVWPQRSLSPFDALRARAVKSLNDVNATLNTVNELSFELNKPDPDGKSRVESPFGRSSSDLDDFQSPEFEGVEDYQNKYDLAIQFAQEHGMDALEQGVAQLIKDQDDPDYDFTEDETNMLLAFQDALKKSRAQSEQSTEVVEEDNVVSDEPVKVDHSTKPARANAKVTEEQVREIRARREAGESYSQLAKEFGLTPTGVRNIALRKTWKHIE